MAIDYGPGLTEDVKTSESEWTPTITCFLQGPFELRRKSSSSRGQGYGETLSVVRPPHTGRQRSSGGYDLKCDSQRSSSPPAPCRTPVKCSREAHLWHPALILCHPNRPVWGSTAGDAAKILHHWPLLALCTDLSLTGQEPEEGWSKKCEAISEMKLSAKHIGVADSEQISSDPHPFRTVSWQLQSNVSQSSSSRSSTGCVWVRMTQREFQWFKCCC